jgi:hypothetical protein
VQFNTFSKVWRLAAPFFGSGNGMVIPLLSIDIDLHGAREDYGCELSADDADFSMS